MNLEDIAAPQFFKLKAVYKKLAIFLFFMMTNVVRPLHCCRVINALKLSNKKIEDIRVAVNGAGAASVAIIKLFFIWV
ncbi:malic enzyme [Peribacillus sp. V2I11]|nr:malic enzyme [Peribacillus sp. V2I11]